MYPRKPAILSHRLSAFTIMELLVVMILSTFVFSMALMAYQIMGGLYRNYEETSTNSVDFDRFRALLGRDIATAKTLHYETPQLFCSIDNFREEKHVVIYQFNPQSIVRSSDIGERLDTVYRGECQVSTYFEAEEIAAGRIDRLTLQLIFFEQPLQLNYEKPSDATYHINRSNLHEY